VTLRIYYDVTNCIWASLLGNQCCHNNQFVSHWLGIAYHITTQVWSWYDLPFQSYDDYNFPLVASIKSQFYVFGIKKGQLSNFIFLTPKRYFLGGNDV